MNPRALLLTIARIEHRSFIDGGCCLMTIVVTLSPELEELLRNRAMQLGQDVNLVASKLLASALEWEEQDSEEASRGIQQGLDDFEAGRFRSFQDFSEEQRRKYNLQANS
jgi:predicted transcriptional regulator